MPISMSEVLKATQLTRLGRVLDATQLIRRTLGLDRQGYRQAPPQTIPASNPIGPHPEFALLEAPRLEAPPAPTMPARPASFTECGFIFDNRRYAYRLYIPGVGDSVAVSPLPLLVMLHGCKQDAADFAQGTAMNEMAEQKKCIVIYPEQLTKSNGMRCWNWFDTAHQARGTGEPGMIAALTREVLTSHHADPARVYIAGLSAGGAMAAVVAGLYPELFAAVGVHSGLPSGAANDVMSAFSAMRRGATKPPAGRENEAAMPTIVFHGSADQTVHPDNGDEVVDVALKTLAASGAALKKIQTVEGIAGEPDSRMTHRTIYRATDGKSHVEHWEVGSGPHAWSGGHATGSYTDPQGPSASAAMLEFFLQHRR